MACRSMLRSMILVEPFQFQFQPLRFDFNPNNRGGLCCKTIKARLLHRANGGVLRCSHNETPSFQDDQGPPQEAVLKDISAQRVAREAERRGCPINLLSVDQYDPSLLPQEEDVIFVVSTTGRGDTPDSMKVFWRYLLQKNLSQHWLKGLLYAVFGLGDSGYQKYNFVAKKLNKRLMDLGGTAILERGLGDDQHPSGSVQAERSRAMATQKIFEMSMASFPSSDQRLKMKGSMKLKRRDA